jgi:outer membrane protein, multidrug efflux system
VQIGLVSDVATAYFSLRQSETLLELSKRTLALVQESCNVNKAKFDAGESNEADYRTAQGQVETAKINIISYERQIAESKNSLEVLLGTPMPADLPAARPFDTTNLVAEVPAGLPSDLLLRRPDILQTEQTLISDNANIGAMRAAFYPSITLSGNVGVSSSDLDKLFTAGAGSWSFGPSLSVPLFNAGKNRANLDAAKVSVQIAVANYQKAIQTAFKEVANALADSHSYTLQIGAEAALVEVQQRRYDLASLSYRQGEGAYLDVLTAQESLFSAQQAQIQAHYNKLNSQITLYKALGGGWKSTSNEEKK